MNAQNRFLFKMAILYSCSVSCIIGTSLASSHDMPNLQSVFFVLTVIFVSALFGFPFFKDNK